jgi:hypothetical protein
MSSFVGPLGGSQSRQLIAGQGLMHSMRTSPWLPSPPGRNKTALLVVIKFASSEHRLAMQPGGREMPWRALFVLACVSLALPGAHSARNHNLSRGLTATTVVEVAYSISSLTG